MSDHLASFRGGCRLSTWLYRITANVVHNHRRRERWRRWLGVLTDDVARSLPSEQPGPYESLEQRESARLVYAVLDKLSERDRTFLILFEIERRWRAPSGQTRTS